MFHFTVLACSCSHSPVQKTSRTLLIYDNSRTKGNGVEYRRLKPSNMDPQHPNPKKDPHPLRRTPAVLNSSGPMAPSNYV